MKNLVLIMIFFVLNLSADTFVSVSKNDPNTKTTARLLNDSNVFVDKKLDSFNPKPFEKDSKDFSSFGITTIKKPSTSAKPNTPNVQKPQKTKTPTKPVANTDLSQTTKPQKDLKPQNSNQVFVQIGAFTSSKNAEQLSSSANNIFGKTIIKQEDNLYKVLIITDPKAQNLAKIKQRFRGAFLRTN